MTNVPSGEGIAELFAGLGSLGLATLVPIGVAVILAVGVTRWRKRSFTLTLIGSATLVGIGVPAVTLLFLAVGSDGQNNGIFGFIAGTIVVVWAILYALDWVFAAISIGLGAGLARWRGTDWTAAGSLAGLGWVLGIVPGLAAADLVSSSMGVFAFVGGFVGAVLAGGFAPRLVETPLVAGGSTGQDTPS